MLSQAVMSTSDSIYITDVEGQIIFVNKAFCQTYGYGEAEIMGRHSRILSEAEMSQKDVKTELPDAFEEGIFYHTRKDGSKFPVSLSRSVIQNEDDQKIAVVNVARDITERRRIEEELRELIVNKDRFFSIISHDLRNPVNFILGFSELLLDGVETLSIEEIKTYIVNINRSARNLSSLLENLLQWAEIQRGKIEYRPVKIELGEIVKTNIDLLQGNADEKEITLLSEIGKNCFVYADRNMLNSIIQNLISNAVKFTRRSGKIKLTANPGDEFIEISVSDTGIGMSPETVAKLFRLDIHHTTLGTAGEKGTGLGLRLCKEFVQKNGGKIWVESEPDEGTTFTFTVPAISS